MTRHTMVRWLKAVSLIGIYGGLLMPLMFVPIVIFPFVFSKILFFQMVIGVTFPAYAVLAWIEPRYRPRFSMLYVAIIAYFVAIGLSTMFSVDVARSWWGNQERMNGLFSVLHFFLWLTMAIGVLKTWADWRRLLEYQIGLSVFMALVAILQKPFPNLLAFPAGDRVGGLLDNPIYMGVYQIFNLFFILLLWFRDSSRYTRIWYVVAAGFDITAFIFAQSRGALVGLVAGLIVFGLFYGLTTANKKARLAVITAAILGVLGYSLLFSLRNTDFIRQSPLDRFTNFSGATRTRLIAWDIAGKGFVERPLTGWGFDTFHILFNQKYNPESLRYGYYETWFDRSHNAIMDIVSMTGLFGLITYLAIWISLVLSVVRAYRRGINDALVTAVLLGLPVAYFIQNLFVFDHPAAFSMSFLMYGLIIAATYKGFGHKEDMTAQPVPSSPSRATPWTILGLLYVLSLFIVWRTSWLPMRASILSIKSNTSFSQGNYQVAYDQARQAFDIPTPYLDEQTYLQARNLISLSDNGQLKSVAFWKEWHDLIVREQDALLADHPRNTHPHFIYARFAQTMSAAVPEDMAIADREYKKAIELSPKRQQLYFGYSRFLIETGRQSEATDILKQAVSFDEEIGEAHWSLGTHLFFDTNNKQEGAAEMIKAHQVKVRYDFHDTREILAIAYVYDFLNDVSSTRALLEDLPKLPRAASGVYIQIAKVFEHRGLIQERNMILSALFRMDPTAAQHLEPLVSGSATSIDAALKMTENLPTTPAVATTSGSAPTGVGPRVQ